MTKTPNIISLTTIIESGDPRKLSEPNSTGYTIKNLGPDEFGVEIYDASNVKKQVFYVQKNSSIQITKDVDDYLLLSAKESNPSDPTAYHEWCTVIIENNSI